MKSVTRKYHYKCAGKTLLEASKISVDVPFVCETCNNNGICNNSFSRLNSDKTDNNLGKTASRTLLTHQLIRVWIWI